MTSYSSRDNHVLRKNLKRSQTGTVTHLVERPLCYPEVVGSIPSRVIPKTFKMVLAALSLSNQHRSRNQNWSALRQYNVSE